jgi:hypothetical protein
MQIMLANLHDCDLLLKYKIISLFHLVIPISIYYTQFLQHKANAELLSRDTEGAPHQLDSEVSPILQCSVQCNFEFKK